MQVEAAPNIGVQTITGGTNFIGNQGNVHVQIGVPPKSRSRPPQPGPEHIGEEQKRVLQDLCKEWIDLHRNLKQRALAYSTAWGRINKVAGSTTYHLILRERFETACAFVRQEMAILRGMKSAPTKDLAWRSSRITAIKVRSKKQLGDPDAYKAYIKKNFKADSLTDLSTDELQRTYSYIMAKKAA